MAAGDRHVSRNRKLNPCIFKPETKAGRSNCRGQSCNLSEPAPNDTHPPASKGYTSRTSQTTPLARDQALKFRSLWRTFLIPNPTGGTANEKTRVSVLVLFTFQHVSADRPQGWAGVNTKTREARRGERWEGRSGVFNSVAFG